MPPTLSIFLTNYNTSHFLELLVYAISTLTKNSYEILINDNGSTPKQLNQLIQLAQSNPHIFVHFRHAHEKHGSLAHGRALDALLPWAQGKYGVVFDSDAVVLKKNWDQEFINRLQKNIKIAGTPLGAAWAGGKATDFPYQFILLFDLAIFNSLNISWQPILDTNGKAVIEKGIIQDTAWEVREKFLAAGYTGDLLIPQNTRFFKKGPFRHLIGVEEYYSNKECTTLFASHFGRGHTGGKAKYRNSIYFLPIVGRLLATYHGQRDIKQWMAICRKIIEKEIQS